MPDRCPIPPPTLDPLLLRTPGGDRRWQRFSRHYARLLRLHRRARRALVRRWRLSLAGIALALTLGLSAPALHAAPAATIDVDGVNCTLADAITAANSDTPTGGCSAGSGADTLNLTANIPLNAALPNITADLTLNGNGYTINGAYAYALLVIDAGVTVSVDNVTLNAGYAQYGGAINNAGTLTLTNSTLTGNQAYYAGGAIYNTGSATITNSDLTDNYADYYGGAIANYGGTLTITGGTIAGNGAGAGSGGGLYTSGSLPVNIDGTTFEYNNALNVGGSIASFSPITITNSTLRESSASAGGGAYLCGNGVSATIENSTISNNGALLGGGLMHTVPLTLTDSTLSGNDAIVGGGFYTAGAHLIMTGSTLSGNSAYYAAAGMLYEPSGRIATSTVSNNISYASVGALMFYAGSFTINRSTLSGNDAPDGNGGAIYLDAGGQLAVNNSTLSGNSGVYGGAIYVDYGDLTLYASTLTGNSAAYGGGVAQNDGSVTLIGSLISGNSAASAGAELYVYGGTLTGDAYNVIGQNGDAGSVGFTPGPSDIVPAGAAATVLNPTLADNGGPTLTHNLVAGSPAINVAPSGPAVDQRGAPRPVAARAGDFDSGAVEYLGVPNAIELATFSAAALPDGGGVRLTWETASELDSAGFNLLRGTTPDGGDRVAVNGALIAATGSNGLGASYLYDDATAGVGTWHYWLEEIDTRGQPTLHGPISIEVGAPTAVTLRRAETQAVGSLWGALALLLATLFAGLRARRNA